MLIPPLFSFSLSQRGNIVLLLLVGRWVNMSVGLNVTNYLWEDVFFKNMIPVMLCSKRPPLFIKRYHQKVSWLLSAPTAEPFIIIL